MCLDSFMVFGRWEAWRELPRFGSDLILILLIYRTHV